MGSKKTLIIKDWLGTGKGDLKLEVLDFTVQRYSYGTHYFDRVTIRRKPDQHTSRFGMMANLNKRHRKLSWGFVGTILKVDEFSNKGAVITRRDFEFRVGAVENSAAEGDLEVITLVTNQIGESCVGKC